VPGLSERHRRSSIGLTGWLRSIAVELGGRPASRLCRRLRPAAADGTLLVDVEAGRVVNVLPDRTSETFVAWLAEHPGAEIICRDRATAYTKAVKEAAPEALEVADRWHLLQNLSAAVEKTCHQHRNCLRKHAEEETVTEVPALSPTASACAHAVRERVRCPRWVGRRGSRERGRPAARWPRDRVRAARLPEGRGSVRP
jgi:hypothetical protein